MVRNGAVLRPAAATASFLLAAALLAGCAGGTVDFGLPSTSSTTAPGAPTSTTLPSNPAAVRLLGTALGNARRQPSLHYRSVSASSTVQVTITGDVAQAYGWQTIEGSGSGHTFKADVEFVQRKAYMTGDALALREFFGFPSAAASTYAGKWISVVPSDSYYAQVSAWLTVRSVVDSMGLHKPVAVGATVGDGSAAVTTLRGTLSGKVPSGVVGSETLSVARLADPLPIEWATKLRGTKSSTDSIAVSRWGEHVTVTAPPSSIPLSSISGGTTTTQPPQAV